MKRKRSRRSRKQPEAPLSKTIRHFDAPLPDPFSRSNITSTQSDAQLRARGDGAKESLHSTGMDHHQSERRRGGENETDAPRYPSPMIDPPLAHDRRNQHRTSSNSEQLAQSEPSLISEDGSESHGDLEDVYADDFDENMFDIFEDGGSDVDTTIRNGLQNEPSNLTSSSTPILQAANNIVANLKSTMKRNTFLGIINLYGKMRYTVQGYENLVVMMKDGNSETTLPCATTMRRVVFPSLHKKKFVASAKKQFSLKKSSSSYIHSSIHSSRPSSECQLSRQSEAVVVLPSSWARMDIRTLHTLREIVCTEHCRCRRTFGKADLRIDSTSHVLNRLDVAKKNDCLWIKKDNVPFPSSVGTRINCHTSDCLHDLRLTENTTGLKVVDAKYRGQSCLSFEAEILSTVHLRQAPSGIYLETGLRHGLSSGPFLSFYNLCLEYLENISRPDCQASDETNSNTFWQSNESVKSDAERLRSQQTRRQKRARTNRGTTEVDDFNENRQYLLPSDHITMLKIDSADTIVVLVSRFWVERLDDERNFILLLRKDQHGKISSKTVSTFGAPVFSSEPSTESTSQNNPDSCQTTGTLDDGRKFYMYRALFYADDFNARSPLFPKGSVGGVYMNPSSMNIRSRRSQCSIRTISLTPPGVSTNSVIDLIIEDIVNGSISGFECIDAFGKHVVVFFDIIGFIGDYPAASAVLDVLGHTAISPCTHCSFVRNNSPGMSMYAFTTSITSSNSTYRRSQKRTFSARTRGLTGVQCKLLGLKQMTVLDTLKSGSSPLLTLASVFNRELVSREHIAAPFPLAQLDGYCMNLIAPDHLITGIFKGVLTATFLQLDDAKAVEKVQICLRALLAEHGFQSQACLFKAGKLMKGLSMSVLYCVLVFLPIVLQSLNYLDTIPTKSMILNLHRFCSMAFWWPDVDYDGAKAWSFVHGDGMDSYHRALQLFASNYVKSVDKFCMSFPDLARLVDKPNTHRLLELSLHTIPLFNHLMYVCELVFESAHQPLKFFLSRNTTLNSHIYSVQLIIAKDWLQRIWPLWHLHRNSKESTTNRHLALISLFRLLVGEEFDEVDWNSKEEDLAEPINEMREHMYSLMSGTVEGRLEKWYPESLISYDAQPAWEVQDIPRSQVLSIDQTIFQSHVVSKLSSLCAQDATHFTYSTNALLNRGFGSKSKGLHERMVVGDTIQLLLKSGHSERTFLDTSVSMHGTPSFFIICAFVKHPHGTWAVVKGCQVLNNASLSQLPDFSQPPVIEVETPKACRIGDFIHFIKLAGSIRKLALIHNCSADGICDFDDKSQKVKHTTCPANGGRFFLVSRSMGFPPRRS